MSCSSLQFPTDETPVDDLVEKSISLIMDTGARISPDLSLINSVQNTVISYNASQSQIKECQNQVSASRFWSLPRRHELIKIDIQLIQMMNFD